MTLYFDSHPPVRMDSGARLDDAAPQRRKHMAKARVKKSWSRKTPKQRLAIARNIIDNLSKTPPPIATPNPTVQALEALYTPAEEADSQIGALELQLKSLRRTRDEKVDALMSGIDLEASTVESATGGDAAQIIAIGYEVVSTTHEPVGPMTQVTNLVVTAGDNEGELNPTWDPTEGAHNYEVQVSTNPTVPGGWVTKLTAPQSNCVIPGLPSGVRHWVRVRANGPLGPGPWSDEASKMVP